MVQKVIAWPHKAAEKFGQEVTQEFVDLINEAVAAVSAAKVDKSEYDAHTALIKEQFEKHGLVMDKRLAELEKKITSALLKGLAWTTVLIAGLFGALYAFVK